MSIVTVLFIFSYLQGTYSQYFGYPSAAGLYQPYNYLSDPSPVQSYYSYPPIGCPASYQPPTLAPSTIAFVQPMYGPTPFPSLPSPASQVTQGLPAQKCSPPTATAYYLPTESKPKTIVARVVEKSSLPQLIKAKEVEQSLTPPAYSCPFCNGFKDVPKNPKVPPPPSSSPVLPGLLDKIPLIDCDCKLKEICKIPAIGLKKSCKLKDKLNSCPLLCDNLKQKLTGKLKFDEDLLDGFLTGLGLKR